MQITDVAKHDDFERLDYEATVDGERIFFQANTSACCGKFRCSQCGHVCDCNRADDRGVRVYVSCSEDSVGRMIADDGLFLCERCLTNMKG